MEEATKVSSDDLPNKDVVNGEMEKEDNDVMDKEEDDATFDGGFVKVEKEGIESKYDDDDDEKQVSSSSGSQRELHELREKAKELELKFEKITGELKRYESENTLLKDELFSTKGRLEETEKKHEELEVVKKKLQEQIVEDEERQRTHLKSLDVKHKELTETKEACDELTQELEKKKASETRFKEDLSSLEEKLKISDERFSKADALLSQALSNTSNLEQRLISSTSQMQEYQVKVEALQVKNSSLEASLSVAMEKLKSAEERLEKQVREIDEATTRSIELEAFHKHSELRIQEADTEVKFLNENSKDLKEKIRLYEDKLAEASSQSLSLKEELDQLSSENELLADTNNQLKLKIQELEGFLVFEKETATERFNQRDIEAKALITKLKSHENIIEEHKRQVLEAYGVANTRKFELEESLSKLKTLEATIKELEKENGNLADVNIKINQELANQGSETSGLQTKVSALESEKDQTKKELHASKTVIENLTNQLTSEGERLQSQISSLAEENNQVNEMYQSTKNDLVKLQEQLEVEKSKSDAMVSETEKLNAVADKKIAELTSKLHEHEHKASDRDLLHKELQASHTFIAEEKEMVSQKYSELEATLKKSQEELETKNSMIVLLESLYKELEQKMQLANAKSKKPTLQETESTDKEEVEVKSRDIDLSFTTPKQRKSKKDSDTSPSHSSSLANITIPKTETSHLMTLKIVLGVALVSIIIGIILGKKY